MAKDIWAGVDFGSSIINPGSVWTGAGGTNQQAVAASSVANANAGVTAPSVASPTNAPAGSQVWNGSSYVPLTAETGYTQPDLNVAAQPGGYTSEIKPSTFSNMNKEAVTETEKKALGLQAALDRNDPNNAIDQKNIAYAKANGLLATLNSPEGKNVVVAVGSQKAKDLLSRGYTLGSKPSGSVSSESLDSAKVVDTGVTSPSGKNYDAEATTESESAIKRIEEELKLREDIKTKEQKKEDELNNLVSDLYGDLKGKTAYEESQLQAKVDPLEAQLRTVKSEIGVLEARKAQALADIQGKPVTMNSIIGAQAQVRAVLNGEILLKTAQANALLGDIETAERQVERAVNAKYAPIEEEIAIAQAQREAISDIVSKQEQIQIDTLNQIDAEKRQAIADAKEAEIAKIKMENSLQLNGYKYVATPAERDRLKAQGYDILEQTDDLGVKRTYAKAPEQATYGGSGGGGGGVGNTTTDENGEPISEFDYGRSIIEANPEATPEQLKTALLENTDLNVTEINSLIAEKTSSDELAIAKAESEKTVPLNYSSEWFTNKISTAKNEGFTDTEITKYIIDNFDIDELFKTAKAEGYASMWTGKESDIKRYIKYLLTK